MQKEIVLYGAGKRGRAVAELLYEHQVEIAGFCDSYKAGSLAVNLGGV